MRIYVTYIMFAMLVYFILILSLFFSSSTQLVFSRVVLHSRVLMRVSSWEEKEYFLPLCFPGGPGSAGGSGCGFLLLVKSAT